MSVEDVETLARIFPDVPPEKLDAILGMLNEPDLPKIAAALDEAAERGKVPDANYTELAADHVVDDDLEAQGFSKEQAVRGMQAEQEATEHPWQDLATDACRRGDLDQLVTLHNQLSEITTTALASPSRETMPGSAKVALIQVSNGLLDECDQAANRGDADRLTEIQTQAAGLLSDDFQRRISEICTNYQTLLSNEGTEFEAAKAWVTDEELTPGQVRQRASQLPSAGFDITYQQMLDITEAAEEWLAEFEELAEEVEQSGGSAAG